MDNERIDDAEFEALFRQAVVKRFDDELDSIPSNEELAKTLSFSPQFEHKMQKLFARDKRREFFKPVRRFTRIAAVVLMVLVSISFAALVVSPELRAAVGRVIVRWFDTHTEITFTGDGGSDRNKSFHLGFLPE